MNLLYKESSPYLLQHSNNPVHWFPWGDAALNAAKVQNKPILLSIGYSACHWCHVMAHESFEDIKTAEIMNRRFINIKVDREERPDLDKTYQAAHSILTGRAGGWPLTVFLTPDEHMPIFAGTYFPKSPRHGLPSFRQILEHISNVYRTRKADLVTQNKSVRAALDLINKTTIVPKSEFSHLPLDVACNQIDQQFDRQYGGYSKPPKFPHPSIIDFSLRHWAISRPAEQELSTTEPQILSSALYTLKQMACGGIFDHLGGGFYRYSTDASWTIPHFEKMLYDNGPLLWLNAQAWSITQDKQFRETAIATADWVVREMQSPDGGYYSAIDADSEGHEGLFYIWSPRQVKSLLDDTIYPVFAQRFGLNRPANFERQWHLHIYSSHEELARQFNESPAALRSKISSARQTLFSARELRVHPGLDDKILCAWNGLMIKGMAHAGRVLENDTYIESATTAAYYIKETMWRNERLLASSKNGVARLNAYLDDYAFLLGGLIELLQSRWNTDLLIWARQIADVLIAQFEDPEHGGFFFTSHDHEKLIQRFKTFSDDAVPTGNGMAACALIDLGYICGNPEYLAAAERALRAAWHDINRAPISHCTLLNAFDKFLAPPKIITLRGSAENLETWQQALPPKYTPHALVFVITSDNDLPAWFNKPVADNTTACAYICEDLTCQPPVVSVHEFTELMEHL
ncbi:MAG: thioredoxin domain-containing protein [Gammaproteobacteria bacterium]|nr:thioredoxin domain-containing protein [Gammaproteobacteria bacterium]